MKMKIDNKEMICSIKREVGEGGDKRSNEFTPQGNILPFIFSFYIIKVK